MDGKMETTETHMQEFESQKTGSQRADPRPQEFYRHFKGGVYQIIALAKDVDTLEIQVVYQALYGNFGFWTRSLSEFMSPVDKEKYPQAGQIWRFEKIGPAEMALLSGRTEASVIQKTGKTDKTDEIDKADRIDKAEKLGKADKPDTFLTEKNNFAATGTKERERVDEAVESTPDSYTLSPLVEQFLDASCISERLQILDAIRLSVTDEIIDTMAIAAGVEVAQGDVQSRLFDLKECLKTIERYEQTRDRFR